MKSLFCSLLAVAVFCLYLPSYSAFAAEHPTEHPKEGEEHPKAGETPAATSDTEASAPVKSGKGKGKKAKKGKKKKAVEGEPTSWNKTKVEKDLIAFIDQQKAGDSGLFVVKDEVNGKDRKLTLDKIHTDKIVKLKDGTSFVCADFKDASGEMVDVDFFMTPSSQGTLTGVDRVQVHKVNGEPRYNYVKVKNEWVQQAVN